MFEGHAEGIRCRRSACAAEVPAHTFGVGGISRIGITRQQQKGKRKFRKGLIRFDGRFQECIQVVRYRFFSLKMREEERRVSACLLPMLPFIGQYWEIPPPFFLSHPALAEHAAWPPHGWLPGQRMAWCPWDAYRIAYSPLKLTMVGGVANLFWRRKRIKDDEMPAACVAVGCSASEFV